MTFNKVWIQSISRNPLRCRVEMPLGFPVASYVGRSGFLADAIVGPENSPHQEMQPTIMRQSRRGMSSVRIRVVPTSVARPRGSPPSSDAVRCRYSDASSRHWRGCESATRVAAIPAARPAKGWPSRCNGSDDRPEDPGVDGDSPNDPLPLFDDIIAARSQALDCLFRP